MSELVQTEFIINCTISAIDKFKLNNIINITDLLAYNRSQIIFLIQRIITKTKDLDESNDSVRQFITECLFPSPTRPYELPWEQKTIWSVIFGAMLIVAITGNCIVIWIVTCHRSMRTITNYYLLNLSIADLLMSSLNCVFNFIFMINSDWPFGSVYCTINNFMANVTVSTSVFTLVAISFDRYIAIVFPLKRRASRKKVHLTLFLIWLISCILAAPCLIFSKTMTKKYYNGKSRTICFMMWPDGRYPTSISDYIYNIIILILTYGIPMLIMLFCYFLMGRVLWGSQSIGENIERQIETMKSKQKVVKMFIVVVSIFAICWLPYHLFFIYAYHNNKISSAKYVQHIYLGFYWLAMSNSMVNPIIYYWMNRRFRSYFRQIMCFRCNSTLKSPTSERYNSVKFNMKNRNESWKLQKIHRQNYNNTSLLHNRTKWNTRTIETQINQIESYNSDNETRTILQKRNNRKN